jgi:hypothetical protein
MRPSEMIASLVTEIGQFEGSQGIETVVKNGYRGSLSPELLAAYEGDENACRRAVQRACYEKVST